MQKRNAINRHRIFGFVLRRVTGGGGGLAGRRETWDIESDGGSPRELAQMERETDCGLELFVRSRTG